MKLFLIIKFILLISFTNAHWHGSNCGYESGLLGRLNCRITSAHNRVKSTFHHQQTSNENFEQQHNWNNNDHHRNEERDFNYNYRRTDYIRPEENIDVRFGQDEKHQQTQPIDEPVVGEGRSIIQVPRNSCSNGFFMDKNGRCRRLI